MIFFLGPTTQQTLRFLGICILCEIATVPKIPHSWNVATTSPMYLFVSSVEIVLSRGLGKVKVNQFLFVVQGRCISPGKTPELFVEFFSVS